MFASVNQGKSRIGAVVSTAAITAADVEIIIRKNGSTAKDDLSGVATGTVRVDADVTTVAHYQYGTDSLTAGDTLTEIVRSIGGNFATQVTTVHVTTEAMTAQLIPVKSASGACATGTTQAVVIS